MHLCLHVCMPCVCVCVRVGVRVRVRVRVRVQLQQFNVRRFELSYLR